MSTKNKRKKTIITVVVINGWFRREKDYLQLWEINYQERDHVITVLKQITHPTKDTPPSPP